MMLFFLEELYVNKFVVEKIFVIICDVIELFCDNVFIELMNIKKRSLCSCIVVL